MNHANGYNHAPPALFACDRCGCVGPHNAPNGDAPWARDSAGGFRHGCGGDAPWSPCAAIETDPAVVAIVLSNRLRCAQLNAAAASRFKSSLAWVLLACVVADRAPPSVWAFALVVGLVARALWCAGGAARRAWMILAYPHPHHPPRRA